MLARPLRTFVMFVAAVLSSVACDSAKAPAVQPSPVAVELPPFQQEIASIKAEVTLPGSWKYGYRLVDKADTSFGGYRAFEFHYAADTAMKVPQRLLLVIRAYHKAAWEKVSKGQVGKSAKLAEHGDDVYTYSIVTSNPYPASTASALRVDAMMLGLIAETSPFRISFK